MKESEGMEMVEKLSEAIDEYNQTIEENKDVIASRLAELAKQAESRPEAYEEVICPFCAAKIWLYSKMEYGYCHFCASKVPFRAAKNKEFSKQLIDYLSGDEYYALLKNDEKIDLKVLQTAAQKGSAIAAFDLGMYYVDRDDYDAAMPYFEIAKDSGSKDGRAMYLLCKGLLKVQSGHITMSEAKSLVSDLESANRNTSLKRCRELVNSVCETVREVVEKESQKTANAVRKAESSKSYASANDEKRDFEEWLARKRCCCRFYIAGICTYYSSSTCKYPSNPGQCAVALNNNGLIFVDK